MDTALFFSTLFQPGDWLLIRPVETWTEAGRKRSRVDYDGIRYERLGLRDAAGDWQAHPEALDATINEARARAVSERTNLFFGVCPRIGPNAAFDKAWQIRTVRVLWSDVDDVGPTEAVNRCLAGQLPRPSAVVSSGNGAHLYWMLAAPYVIHDDPPPAVHTEWIDSPAGRKPREYLVDPDTKERLYLDACQNVPPLPQAGVELQDILAGIAAKIGGDHVQDLARLLRIPETWNRKNERTGQQPVKCQLVELDLDRRYAIEDFLPLATNSPARKRRHQVAQVRLPAAGKVGKRQQARLHDLANACAVADVGARSEADFALCCYAVEHGLPRDQVWQEVAGVGKFAEAGERYFSMTWEAAEGHTREQIYDQARGKADARKAKQEAQQATSETTALEADDDPHRLARIYLGQQAWHPDHGYTLRWWREEWWQWTGTHYRRISDADMRSRVNGAIKQEFDRLNLEAQDAPQGEGVPRAGKVTAALVTNVLGAMGAMTVADAIFEQMGWVA